jgi:HlyD family secretion protein
VLRVPEESERIVTAGAPILELGDTRALEVVTDVLSTDAVRIRPGAEVQVVDWGGDSTLIARVRSVEPAGFTRVSALGVEEQRVNVVADLPEPPAGLGDGFKVEARVVVWRGDSVLTVPASALFQRGSSWHVFVVEGGRARLRDVTVGHRAIATVEIVRGLAERAEVILFPSDRLEEGTRVR